MPERLTASTLTNELRAQFNLEKGLLRTAVDLTVRPATMLMSYLNGTQRRNYVGVVAYFILAISVTIGMEAIFRVNDASVQETRTESPGLEGIGISDEEYWLYRETIDNKAYYAEYPFLPIAALVTLWFFLNWGLSYLEHLVINAFVIAHSTFICLPLYLAYAVLPSDVAMGVFLSGSFVVVYAYFCLVYSSLTRLHHQASYLRDIVRSATAAAVQLMVLVIFGLVLAASIELAFIKWNAEMPSYEVPEHSPIPEALIGTWMGTDKDGSKIAYTFDRDSSIQLHIGDSTAPEIEADYLVKTDVEPMQMYMASFSEDGERRQAIPFMQFVIENERLTLCRAGDFQYSILGIGVGPTWLAFPTNYMIDCMVLLRQ